MSDDYIQVTSERGLVRKATPDQCEVADLGNGEGEAYAVDLGGGSVLVFRGFFQLLQKVERCSYCGRVGGH